MPSLLRGKKVDKEIIAMFEAYLKLYKTLDYSKWKDYGDKAACRMCNLVGIGDYRNTDCNKCPLWQAGDYVYPCVDSDNTSLELEDMIFDIIEYGDEISEQIQRDIIRARIDTLYRILKNNGYFG